MNQNLNEMVKSISCQIRRESLDHGFLLATLAASMLYIIVGYYIVVDPRSLSLGHSPTLMFGLILLYLGYITSCKAQYNANYLLVQCISSTLIGFSFLCLSLVVKWTWMDPEGAKKILLMAFFVMLMSCNAHKAILALGTLPIVAFYCYLTYIQPNTNGIDLMLSTVKFPLFVAMFYSTVYRFHSRAEDKFVDSAQTIARLKRSSHIDELTRIKNRKGFNKGLESAIGAASRSQSALTVVIMDIDFFKQYNDALGHPAGDQCLKFVASVINAQCQRRTDIVARIGGEEFALVLPFTRLHSATKLVRRIQSELEKARIVHPSSPISPFITVSAGIAGYRNGDDFYRVYGRADKAMYKAKMAGRNQLVSCCNTCTGCSLERENNNENI